MLAAQNFVVISERRELYLVLTDESSGCKASNLNAGLNIFVYSVPL